MSIPRTSRRLRRFGPHADADSLAAAMTDVTQDRFRQWQVGPYLSETLATQIALEAHRRWKWFVRQARIERGVAEETLREFERGHPAISYKCLQQRIHRMQTKAAVAARS